jgi:hypothetical protein
MDASLHGPAHSSVPVALQCQQDGCATTHIVEAEASEESFEIPDDFGLSRA